MLFGSRNEHLCHHFHLREYGTGNREHYGGRNMATVTAASVEQRMDIIAVGLFVRLKVSLRIVLVDTARTSMLAQTKIIPTRLACKTEERAGTYADILGLGVRSFSVFIKEFPNKRLLSEKSFVNLQPLKAIEV